MKEWIFYLQSGLFVESVTRMLPKFLWPPLPLKAVNKNLLVCLFVCGFLSLRHFKYVSSRPLLVRPWEIDVPAVFGMPFELNNCMIFLPEWVPRFCVARSTHASRVCRSSVPLVPRAKLCKSTHGNLAARHSVQVHSSVVFLGLGMHPYMLVWHSQCATCADLLCATPMCLAQLQAPAFCFAGTLHVTWAPTAVLSPGTAGWACVRRAW